MQTLDCLALEITQDAGLFGHRVLHITEVAGAINKVELASAEGFKSYPEAQQQGMQLFIHHYTHLSCQRMQESISTDDFQRRFRLPELLEQVVRVRPV